MANFNKRVSSQTVGSRLISFTSAVVLLLISLGFPSFGAEYGFAFLDRLDTPSHGRRISGRQFNQAWVSGWEPRSDEVANPFGRVGPGSTSYWGEGPGADGKDSPRNRFPNKLGLSEEKKVHFGAISHNDTSPMRDWQIRLGAGSQVYSIITDYGELIGAQQAECGAIWNDAVLQLTTRNIVADDLPEDNDWWYSDVSKTLFRVSADANRAGDCIGFYNRNSDIHQAGTYAFDLTPSPSYSDVLQHDAASFQDPSRNASVRTVVWPRVSHLPTSFPVELTIGQKVSDVGNGVARFDLTMHNFGKETYEEQTLWSSFNRRTFDANAFVSEAAEGIYLSSDSEGNIKLACPASGVGIDLDFDGKGDGCEENGQDLANSAFGGWLSMARPIYPDATSQPFDPANYWGMGIVLGKGQGDDENRSSSRTYLTEHAGPNIKFSSIYSKGLPPHHMYRQTYYLIFDRLDLVESTAKAILNGTMPDQNGNLLPIASFGVERLNDVPSPGIGKVRSEELRAVCERGNELVTDCDSNREPIGYIFPTPQKGLMPVFELTAQGESEPKHLYTSDPHGRTDAAGFGPFSSKQFHQATTWPYVKNYDYLFATKTERGVKEYFKALEDGDPDTRITPNMIRVFTNPIDRTIFAPYADEVAKVTKLLGYAFPVEALQGSPYSECLVDLASQYSSHDVLQGQDTRSQLYLLSPSSSCIVPSDSATDRTPSPTPIDDDNIGAAPLLPISVSNVIHYWSTVTLEGQGEPGAQLRIREGSGSMVTVGVDDSGKWVSSIPSAPDGQARFVQLQYLDSSAPIQIAVTRPSCTTYSLAEQQEKRRELLLALGNMLRAPEPSFQCSKKSKARLEKVKQTIKAIRAEIREIVPTEIVECSFMPENCEPVSELSSMFPSEERFSALYSKLIKIRQRCSGSRAANSLINTLEMLNEPLPQNTLYTCGTAES
jgi:hypothetical protein